MIGIPIYEKKADDYSTNGLGLLTPLEATVEEVAAGMYELTLVHPIDDTYRWSLIQPGRKVKCEVPVRESPLYEYPEGSQTQIVREIYKVVGTSVGVRLRTGPGTGYARLSTHRDGTLVVKLDQPNADWMHVILVNGGAEGYMSTEYLQLYRQETENVPASKPGGGIISISQSRDQLFTIYEVETDTNDMTVTAKAMHEFYAQRGNVIGECNLKKVPMNMVLPAIEEILLNPNPIQWVIRDLNAEITLDCTYKTPVEVFLDPDEGIIKQSKAILVRDNFTAYLLPDKVRDKGVTVRRRKNLASVNVKHDESEVVTRIVPVGKKKDGKPLYLSGSKYPNLYIDSNRINDYPQIMSAAIEYDVSVGDPSQNEDNADDKTTVFKTEDEAMAELERLARLEYTENNIDLPVYGMEVDMVLLQNTPEYADYAALQSVHLYDTVTVIDELIGLRSKIRVTGYTWNVLTRQYDSITLGELQELQQTVYSFNLPDGGISGTKIENGSASGDIIRDLSIQYAKIAVAAIQQLNADALTAMIARINEVVAGKITTDELYAGIAEIVALKVSTLTAGDIETDSLAAELARLQVLIAGTATFDKATVQHLVAEALNLTFGVGDTVFIKNLMVDFAQMVSAQVGSLCIKASDGNYYTIDVNADGTLTATRVDVSEGEIGAGETENGKLILDTNITAENLSTANLLATYALINQIDAARIDVDQLFARETFTARLVTGLIVGDKSLTMIAGDVENMADLRTAMKIDNEGVHIRDAFSDDSLSTADTELLLTKTDVNVVSEGVRSSTFGKGYVRLLDMIIRASDGGIVIEAAES